MFGFGKKKDLSGISEVSQIDAEMVAEASQLHRQLAAFTTKINGYTTYLEKIQADIAKLHAEYDDLATAISAQKDRLKYIDTPEEQKKLIALSEQYTAALKQAGVYDSLLALRKSEREFIKAIQAVKEQCMPLWQKVADAEVLTLSWLNEFHSNKDLEAGYARTDAAEAKRIRARTEAGKVAEREDAKTVPPKPNPLTPKR